VKSDGSGELTEEEGQFKKETTEGTRGGGGGSRSAQEKFQRSLQKPRVLVRR